MPLRSADRLNSPYSTIASSISEPCAHEATCVQYWPHECSRPEPDTETGTLVGGHHPVCGPLRLGRAMVGALAAHSATLAWRSFGFGEGTAQQKEAAPKGPVSYRSSV